MKEIDLARELLQAEFTKLNRKLADSKGSARTDGGVEARFTLGSYNEQLEGLLRAAELIEAIEGKGIGK